MAITNLSGTTWLLPLTVVFEADRPFHGANINFNSNNTNYAYLDVGDEQSPYIEYGVNAQSTTQVYDASAGWLDAAYRKITISGGNDANDPYVVNWFTSECVDVTPNVVLKGEDYADHTYTGVKSVSLPNTAGGTTKYHIPSSEELTILQDGIYDTSNYGSVNVSGVGGTTIYEGTDLTYDALGMQAEAALSDVPIRVGDYYLITSDYTDSGHSFYLGDLYVCTSVGASTADLSFACNIRGPQGATGPSGKGVYISTETTTSSTTSMDPSLIYNPDSRTLGAGDVLISATGDVFTITSISALSVSVTYRESIVGPAGSNGQNGAQGSLIFYGASAVYHTGGSGGAFVIDKTNVPDMRLGDFYLSTSTYTSDGETISSGDLWVAFSGASTRWVLSRVMNLTGPQGPAGAGMPAVTIADAGKFAVVDSSGNWSAKTMTEWSGGSY